MTDMGDLVSWLTKEQAWYNQERLERFMEAEELDAVIARSARNVVYLSGIRLPGTLHRLQEFASSPRPLLVVYPIDEEPTLVSNRSAYDLAKKSGWIDDLRSHVPYTESPWEVCVRRIEELGFEDGRIGVERPELTIADWEFLNAELPDATFVDFFDGLNGVRNIKTEPELDMLRRAVKIQDEAHKEVFRSADPGMTEKELHAEMVESMIRRGAEWAHGMLQSDNTPMMYGGEGPVPIEQGDLIKTDYVCYYQGYAANLSRMAVMGEASPEQEGMYSDLLEIHQSTYRNKLKPGVEAQEIWEHVQRQIEEKGYSSFGTIMNTGTMAGHSTGVWWHQEEPIFVESVETALQPGMVVCLEPMVDANGMGGFWHLQDQFLITEDGATWMSDEFDITGLYQIT